MNTNNNSKKTKDLCGPKKANTKQCALKLEVRNFLAAMSEINRLKIMLLVKKEALSVTEIYEALKIPQNLASHHIARLKENELLIERKEGTFRFYSLNEKALRRFGKQFSELFSLKK